ncbi:MAG: 2-succinyl-5-enolpyruvyl-6-hydroxy-3-cyclohexene-1-carboxylic-acid synthase, partial [Parachlamydiaceae bacterium]|nr:2-succinyl-5-enolpyruvyl-6-hydroxy-3-cyclohexene-1-carboxylic-acid synthase [Parachlamydiaceae bacterium]
KEFCICPGSRNSPLITGLMNSPSLAKYNWYEERSAAFFALGRARLTGIPVAVVTTSGTAAGELLPAAMEAHYSGTPLLLITADRPRRFRGSGAPQSAEQVGLFGVYAEFAQDIEADEGCQIMHWDWSGPAHLNVCIEDPKSYNAIYHDLSPLISERIVKPFLKLQDSSFLDLFFEQSRFPLVVVGSLHPEERESVIDFLVRLNIPVYSESASGLRENASLAHLQVRMEVGLWKLSASNGYVIDGILRIGGVPVTRLWRDLEERFPRLAECSISRLPFSGLSWGRHIQCDINTFLTSYRIPDNWQSGDYQAWLAEDSEDQQLLSELFEKFPSSEPALFQALSEIIPDGSMVYLGNSLPVREWDLAASFKERGINIQCSRGLNGIDGQISTFLGLCQEGRENWAIVGDLTALYDFAALWILHALPKMPIKIVVMNNGGGKIFARIYKDPVFQHLHHFDFEHFAKSWKIPYYCMEGIIENNLPPQAFVEVCPDPAATVCFWSAYDELMQKAPVS